MTIMAVAPSMYRLPVVEGDARDVVVHAEVREGHRLVAHGGDQLQRWEP